MAYTNAGAHFVKGHTAQLSWTELNWDGLVFDELNNGQAVMHYSK